MGPIGSEWHRIIDTGKTDSQGRNLQEVILEIMRLFPLYDLDSEQAFRMAAGEMRVMLDNVSGY
jgi:hypothetical protein